MRLLRYLEYHAGCGWRGVLFANMLVAWAALIAWGFFAWLGGGK